MQFKKIAFVFLLGMIFGITGTANAACNQDHLADCDCGELLGMINDTLLSVKVGLPIPVKTVYAGTKEVVLGNFYISAFQSEDIELEEMAISYPTVNYYGVYKNVSYGDIKKIRLMHNGEVLATGSFENGWIVIKFPEKYSIDRGSIQGFQIVGDFADSAKGKVVSVVIPANSIKAVGAKSGFRISSPSKFLWIGMNSTIEVI